MRSACLQAGILTVAVAGSVTAQNDCMKDVRWPAVGKWAEYATMMNDKPGRMRYAVIGTETRGGVRMKWIEMRIIGENKARNMTYQMLMPGEPKDIGKTEEVIFKSGDKQAMKMGGAMMGLMRGQLENNSVLSNLCEGVTLVGEESVTVPAGTIQTFHFHNTKYDSDAWVSPKVPFIMVKSVGKHHKMELASTGDGAKSSITETPTEMPGLGPSKK